MKISELIEKLQAIKDNYGDMYAYSTADMYSREESDFPGNDYYTPHKPLDKINDIKAIKPLKDNKSNSGYSVLLNHNLERHVSKGSFSEQSICVIFNG
ncbi:MAG: hypothetical protein ACOC44_19810 [Promethearchaeia archaeon]